MKDSDHRKKCVEEIVSYMMKDAESRFTKVVESFLDDEVVDTRNMDSEKDVPEIVSRLSHRMEKGWDVSDSWCLSRVFMDKFPDILRMMAKDTMGCPVPDWAPDAPHDDTRYEAWVKYLNSIADSLEKPEYDPEMMDADESEQFKWAVAEIAKNIHLMWN